MGKKDVFIVGSGFSKDVAQYPTLLELGGLDGPVLSRIKDPLISNFISKKCPKSILNNIEHLITYLHQEYPWRNEEDSCLAKAVYYSIVKSIGIVFNEYDKELDNNTQKQEAYIAAIQLITYLHKWELPVITFNYDTLIESLAKTIHRKILTVNVGSKQYLVIIKEESPLHDKGVTVGIDSDGTKALWIARNELEYFENKDKLDVWLSSKELKDEEKDNVRSFLHHNNNLKQRLEITIREEELYQFPIVRLEQRTHSLLGGEFTPTLKLYKLHGSVNWMAGGGFDSWQGEIYLVDRDREGWITGRNKRDLYPLLIPPVLDKSGFYVTPGIRYQWRYAADHIKKASRIFIIGYSFPETDLASLFFINESIALNSVSEFVVVNRACRENGGLKKRF